MDSIDRLVAAHPVLIHFFDLAQLNSVRTVPYLRAWHERYVDHGLAMIGVHSPRFPFTQVRDVVADSSARLGIEWPVLVDAEFAVWRLYEPHGWPALFLWGRGGALRWYHLGEGDYDGTERAIREALDPENGDGWPPLLEPIRPSDAPGVKVIAPTPEIFPGGSTESPLIAGDADTPVQIDYEAAGAYAATDGIGRIDIRLDGFRQDPVTVADPGLQELVSHDRTERHRLELRPSAGLRIYSIQFAAGLPRGG